MPRRTVAAGYGKGWRAVSAHRLAALFIGLALVMVGCGGSQTGGAPTPTPKPPCTTWRVVAIPDGTRYLDSRLAAVSAVPPTDTWTVGINCTEGGTVGPLTSLIERWDGSAWAGIAGSLPSGAEAGFLSGVAAAGPRDVRAVGGSFTGGAGMSQALIAQWDGAAWHVVESPAPSGASYRALNAVATDGAGN